MRPRGCACFASSFGGCDPLAYGNRRSAPTTSAPYRRFGETKGGTKTAAALLVFTPPLDPPPFLRQFPVIVNLTARRYAIRAAAKARGIASLSANAAALPRLRQSLRRRWACANFCFAASYVSLLIRGSACRCTRKMSHHPCRGGVAPPVETVTAREHHHHHTPHNPIKNAHRRESSHERKNDRLQIRTSPSRRRDSAVAAVTATQARAKRIAHLSGRSNRASARGNLHMTAIGGGKGEGPREG